MNSIPNVTTRERPFDLVFISHPDIVHAVFDLRDGIGVGALAERLAAANARLTEAREAIELERRRQKERYDRGHAPLPDLRVGDEVFVRLRDRPLPGVQVGKFAPGKAGPYRVREVLSPHRVRLEIPDLSASEAEFSVEQLDVTPSEPDPFAGQRHSPTATPSGPATAAGPSRPTARIEVDDPPASLPPRVRQAPPALRC
ncbi:hypothetical protein A4X13_0g7563 [Tilletia indica]|uniref:Integrase zinc-binding domain-containing protein n=1 Tax=Tilletia indica TaxID=43049 RepID=A0A177T3R2_9BASI|nr:hypothetical protein A4X13_0g7563 [Tilletia indica]